jgi:UDP-N-acetylglucosamine 4,6-dehydratase
MGAFYRIPADARDLNYSKFFSDGEEPASPRPRTTPPQHERLDVDEVVKLLLAWTTSRRPEPPRPRA